MSFDLIICVIGTERFYRISREDPRDSSTLRHYDFRVSTAGHPAGTLLHVKIPYRSSDYLPVSPVNSNPSDYVPGTGQQFEGHLFKLIMLEPGAIDRGVPSLVDTNSVYTISSIALPFRFVFFRLIGGVPQYTGVMGSLKVDGDYIPSLSIDVNQLINQVTAGGIIHYIIRLNGTPNVVLTAGVPSTSVPAITEVYTTGPYEITLSAPGNGFSNIGLLLNVSIVRVDQQPYDGDVPTITAEDPSKIDTVLLTSSAVVAGVGKYSFSVITKPNVSSIDIKAVLPA